MRTSTAIVASVVVVLAVVVLAAPLVTIDEIVVRTYVEGWIADHTARLASGAPLYDPANPYNPFNYPPLYPVLLTTFAGADSDWILLGRRVAFASALATSAAIFLAARRLGTGRAEALVGAAFALSFLTAAFPGYVVANDPTLAGLAFSTLGLALFWKRWDDAAWLFAVALLVCMGGLIKHHLVAVPIAIAVFLLAHDRRAAVRWLAMASGVLACALLVLWLVYGSAFFELLLAARRTGADHLLGVLPKRMATLLFPLAVATGVVAWQRTALEARWVGCYGGMALAVAIAFSAGDGVHHNVFFDVVVAIAIALALGVGAAARSESRAVRQCVWVLPLVALLPVVEVLPRYSVVDARQRSAARERETALDLDHLRMARNQFLAEDAPLLCETPALCYWAGVPIRFDLFNTRQGTLTGELDEAPLLDAVGGRAFAAIQLSGLKSGPWHDRVSPELLRAIGTHYRILRNSENGWFFQPNLVLDHAPVSASAPPVD